MEENWNKVVNHKNKKQIEQHEAMERIKDRYADYFNDDRAREMVDGLVASDESEQEEEDERLCSALKEMHNIPMNPHPPDPRQNISQEEAEQIEKEYLENSYTTSSPWMRRAFTFTDQIPYSKEDLKIPHFKEKPKDGIVLLDKSDYVPIRQGWGICLLGMFAGRFPGKDGVFQLMQRWKVKARVSFHRKGWMLFQFQSEKDLEYTRQAGPFSQYGIPLILQPVPEKFKFDMAPEINIPVWIKLVDLEPYYWHENAIGKLASMVGVPVGADFKSLRKESMDWPRIQVIIDASKPPIETVTARDFEGEEFKLKVEFEYIPKFCISCKMFGHYMDSCKGPDKIPPQQLKGPPQHGRNRSPSRQGRPQPQQAKAPPQKGRNRSLSRQGRAPLQQARPPPQQGKNRSLSRLGRPPLRENQTQHNNRSMSRGERPKGAVRFGWAVEPTEAEIKKHGYKKNWLDAEGKVIIHKNTNYPFLAGRGFRRMDPQPSKPPQDSVASPNRFEALADLEDGAEARPQTVLGAQPPKTSTANKIYQVQPTPAVVSPEGDRNEELVLPAQGDVNGELNSHEISPSADANLVENVAQIHGSLVQPFAPEELNEEEIPNISNLFHCPEPEIPQKQITSMEEEGRTFDTHCLNPKPNQHLYFSDNNDEDADSGEDEEQGTPINQKVSDETDRGEEKQKEKNQQDLENDDPYDNLVVALKVPTSSEKRMGRRQREREEKRRLMTGSKRVTRSSSVPGVPEGCVPENAPNKIK